MGTKRIICREGDRERERELQRMKENFKKKEDMIVETTTD